MNADLREKILQTIEKIDEILELASSEIQEILSSLSKEIIASLSKVLEKPFFKDRLELTFGIVKRDIGVKVGLKHSKEEIIFANWILDLQHNTKRYLLIFLLLKECIKQFFQNEWKEEDEAILNIASTALLAETLKINTLDNPVLSAIRAKIYSEEIAGLSYLRWDNLLVLLITKKIPVVEIIGEFSTLLINSKSTSEKVKQFSNWVTTKTVQAENVILPIYTNEKLIDLIETLLDFGYDRSSTSLIAKKTNLTQKTISKHFKALNENYATFWTSSVNFEEMNLHNYLVRIRVTNDTIAQKIVAMLLDIPYLKSIFKGYDAKSKIVYSPSLICPHYISEELNSKLLKLKNSGSILDFSVQLIREKFSYFTVSNFPYNPTEKTFRKLIADGDDYLRKYLFSHEKRSSVLPISDKPISLDYNLLYFLSIIRGKYLLQARYAVWINEFQEFYKENKILTTDVKSQTDLLYQNELRAKKKGLLSFSLYMRNFVRYGSEVCVFEVPIQNDLPAEELQNLIDRLRIFAFFGKINLYDRNLFLIPGISHEHPVGKIVYDELDKEGLSPSAYTIKIHKSNYIPLHNLFDFDAQKWKLSDL